MSILTTVTRMWLTKSTSPFEFKNEYDKVLEFNNLSNLGYMYIYLFVVRYVVFVLIAKKNIIKIDVINT